MNNDAIRAALGDRITVYPCGTTGILVSVGEHGPVLVDGTARHALVWARIERWTYATPAAPRSPKPPRPTSQPQAGGTAAKVAGPKARAWMERQRYAQQRWAELTKGAA